MRDGRLRPPRAASPPPCETAVTVRSCALPPWRVTSSAALHPIGRCRPGNWLPTEWNGLPPERSSPLAPPTDARGRDGRLLPTGRVPDVRRGTHPVDSERGHRRSRRQPNRSAQAKGPGAGHPGRGDTERSTTPPGLPERPLPGTPPSVRFNHRAAQGCSPPRHRAPAPRTAPRLAPPRAAPSRQGRAPGGGVAVPGWAVVTRNAGPLRGTPTRSVPSSSR